MSASALYSLYAWFMLAAVMLDWSPALVQFLWLTERLQVPYTKKWQQIE